MIVATSARLATLGPRLRTAILVLAALFVAHDAVYLGRYGHGPGYDHAMSALGHDAYWVPVSVLLTAGVALLVLAGIAGHVRLHAAAGRTDDASPVGPSYPGELVRTWLRLFPSVAILFTIQENVEHLIGGGDLVGLSPLVGAADDVALPILAATTFVLAAVGAVVRWRIRVLEARVACAARRLFALVRVVAVPTAWLLVGASVVHRWVTVRPDAGRAPPRSLHSNAVTTA
jgi:hypothetical protein